VCHRGLLRARGFDISRRTIKSVFDLYKSGTLFGYVITVCDEGSAQRRPIFLGVTQRLHWNFPDPSSAQGTPGGTARASTGDQRYGRTAHR